MWTILYFDYAHNNVTNYHFNLITKNNLDHQVINLSIKNDLPAKKAWRNCDALMRNAVKKIFNQIENENILFVEWDVYFNYHMPECKFEYAFSKFTNTPDNRPQWCHWKNQEHKKLPEALQTFAKNITPFCLTGYKKFVLQELLKSSWDDIYNLDIFCEVRTGTVLNYIGYPSQGFPDEIAKNKSTIFAGSRTKLIEGLIIDNPGITGILHPVKQIL